MDILNDKAFYDDEGEYGKYVLNKLILPMPQGSEESIKNYACFVDGWEHDPWRIPAERILVQKAEYVSHQ